MNCWFMNHGLSMQSGGGNGGAENAAPASDTITLNDDGWTTMKTDHCDNRSFSDNYHPKCLITHFCNSLQNKKAYNLATYDTAFRSIPVR